MQRNANAPGRKASRLMAWGAACALALGIAWMAVVFWSQRTAQAFFEKATEATIETASGEKRVFSVRIASTGAQKRRGLQHVAHLPQGEGMLFPYERPGDVRMWMKDTIIPLDMVFMRGGRIVYVRENASPESEEVIAAPEPVDAVFEIGGGEAARLGIRAGDRFFYRPVDVKP
ncbi:MAG: DUF192 domain-containing protein [Rickettsiales bacterium]